MRTIICCAIYIELKVIQKYRRFLSAKHFGGKKVFILVIDEYVVCAEEKYKELFKFYQSELNDFEKQLVTICYNLQQWIIV